MRAAAIAAAVLSACVSIPEPMIGNGDAGIDASTADAGPSFPTGGEKIVGGISADLDGNGFDDLVLLNQPDEPADAGFFVIMNPELVGSTTHRHFRISDHQIGAVQAVDGVAASSDPSALDLVVLARDSGQPKLFVYPGLNDGSFDPPVALPFGDSQAVEPASSFILSGNIVPGEPGIVVASGNLMAAYQNVPRAPQALDAGEIRAIVPGAVSLMTLIGGYLRPTSDIGQTYLDVIVSDGRKAVWLQNDGTGVFTNDGGDAQYGQPGQQFFLPGRFVPTDPCNTAVLARGPEIDFVVPAACDEGPSGSFHFTDAPIDLRSPDIVTRLAVAAFDTDGRPDDLVYVHTEFGTETSPGATRLVSLSDIVVTDSAPPAAQASPREHNNPTVFDEATLDKPQTEISFVIPGDFANQGREQLYLVTESGELFCHERNGTTFNEFCTTP